MPTALRVGGFQFIIFSSDHPPAHVHVRHEGKLAKVELSSVTFIRIGGFSASDQRRALRAIQDHYQELLAAWDELHPPEESRLDES